VVALAFFIGGQLLLVAVVVPSLRGRDEAAMLAVARRFGVGTIIALGVLVVTGFAMADHFGRWSDDTLQAKLAVLVLAGVLMALHVASPRSRPVSIALLLASLAVAWLGVALTH